MVREKSKKEKSPKPKYNMFQNAWYMVKFAWSVREKKVIFLTLLTSFLAVSQNLVDLYISPIILSAVERHVSVTELILTILGFVLAAMFVAAASSYVDENIFYGRISVRTEVINMLNHKLCTTSYCNFDNENFKDLFTRSSRLNNGNSAATEQFYPTMGLIITNLAGFAIYIILLGSVRPLLIAIILITSLIGYFISNYLNGYGYRHREEASEYDRHIDYFETCCKDTKKAKDIRIFGLRPWIEDLYDKSLKAYMAYHRRAQGVYIWASIADLILAFLRNGIAYIYLIGMVVGGSLSVAEFLLYFSTVGGFSNWVTGILNNFTQLHKMSLDIATIRECLEYKEPFKFDDGEPIKADAGRAYELKLENVSYRYPKAEDYTLKNINLTLHPGEKLAVVGLNGAGKTTLIKLICGFLDPTEGRVLLDGRDIRELNRRDYYTMFSAVFQDYSLLAGSIATNVAQNDVDIDYERVKECIEKAGLTKKVESLPDGLETFLNRSVYEEAIMLSGGETQRLMLARALYKNAPFIILDEPTAALDPIAESEMYQKYNEMSKGRSSVYISHRLASTRFCDRIIMIDNGGIGEEGTHEELLAAGRKYAGLYGVQSKYYKEGGEDNGEE